MDRDSDLLVPGRLYIHDRFQFARPYAAIFCFQGNPSVGPSVRPSVHKEFISTITHELMIGLKPKLV